MADFFGGGGEDDVSDSGISGKEVACEVDGLSCGVSMFLNNKDNSAWVGLSVNTNNNMFS